ncbi:MAG: hypothetical protein RL233_417 [Bacteroidota bacterium]
MTSILDAQKYFLVCKPQHLLRLRHNNKEEGLSVIMVLSYASLKRQTYNGPKIRLFYIYYTFLHLFSQVQNSVVHSADASVNICFCKCRNFFEAQVGILA